MYSLPTLTPPQDQVLALISAGSTISDAAQSAGVHRNTVHNWIDSAPHFRLALARARESKALFWREESERLAAAAVDTIRAIMTEASTPAGVRLKAAQFILALAMAPPPEQQAPSLLDLFPRPIAAPPGAMASESGESPVGSAQQPPAPQIVHNSAQSTPEPPAPETAHNPAERPLDPFRCSSSKVGRNDFCPCGSGRKFKRCCLKDGGGGAPSGLGAVA